MGEEAAAAEGDFVPPCIGQCLKLPPTGVTEGMQFEVGICENKGPKSSVSCITRDPKNIE